MENYKSITTIRYGSTLYSCGMGRHYQFEPKRAAHDLGGRLKGGEFAAILMRSSKVTGSRSEIDVVEGFKLGNRARRALLQSI
jgi:hypothetical protein